MKRKRDISSAEPLEGQRPASGDAHSPTERVKPVATNSLLFPLTTEKPGSPWLARSGAEGKAAEEGVDDSADTCGPYDLPPTPVSYSYDAEFGARVCRAFDDNAKRKIHLRQLQQLWREQEYGPEIAHAYSHGHTPKHVREEYELRQDAALRTFLEELEETTTDEEAL